jgi:hypothetical protein
MSTSTSHLRAVPFEAPDVVPITAYQFDILVALERNGSLRAFTFDEGEVDELFRMRPRLIRLVPGYDDPVIAITVEGRERLEQERKGAS